MDENPPTIRVCACVRTSTVSSFPSTSSLTTGTGPGVFRWELSSTNVGSGDVFMFVLEAPSADVLVSAWGTQPFILNTNTFLRT